MIEENPDEEILNSLAEMRDQKFVAADLKDEKCWQELTKPVNMKHLFKCMAKIDCAFSSDNAAKFRLHLDEVHSGQKSKSRHGWLRCSVCLKKLGSPSSLIRHVIKHHGFSSFQCRHCFFRASSELGIFIHQKVSMLYNFFLCQLLPKAVVVVPGKIFRMVQCLQERQGPIQQLSLRTLDKPDKLTKYKN